MPGQRRGTTPLRLFDDPREPLERSLRKSSRIAELVARLAERKAEVKASEAQFDVLVREALER